MTSVVCYSLIIIIIISNKTHARGKMFFLNWGLVWPLPSDINTCYIPGTRKWLYQEMSAVVLCLAEFLVLVLKA